VNEQQVAITTRDGQMSTFIVHPERDGPFPVVLFYMDAPGIREELRDMARRIAATGYYVMLPNLYYRAGVEEPAAIGADRDKIWSLMGSLRTPMVMDDTDALLAFADTQAAARKDVGGTVGYCMSGTYAINAAARHPDRLKAAASFYGVSLVTKRDDSPHLTARQVTGEIYVGAAEIDPFITLDEVRAFAEAMAAAGVRAEVEIHPGVHHGFAFPQRDAYDKPAAERHWERLHALFRRNLG